MTELEDKLMEALAQCKPTDGTIVWDGASQTFEKDRCRFCHRIIEWENDSDDRLKYHKDDCIWLLAKKHKIVKKIPMSKVKVSFNKVRCPDCGSVMVSRNSKYGRFWGCSNYPTCRRVLKRPEIKYCPKCHSEMITQDFSTDYNKCSNEKCDYSCRVRWPIHSYGREPYNPHGWSDADWAEYGDYCGVDSGVCWGLDS